ncbi:MAG TPA: trypsin-like peptidase domain-containing protein [Patescibacteria group bacterium]
MRISGGDTQSTSPTNTETIATNQTSTSTPTPSSDSAQKDNIASVVNIFCDNEGGGSGTIFSESGTIVTNNHVITGSSFCLVTLADTTTGTPTGIYLAKPEIVPQLSEQYDIALLNIYDAYTDSDGKVWGTYPRTFPAFKKPEICTDELPKLGDSIKIYGYPVTSGGYNLTITEGVISSFASDGNILTSAKIDSGNSGGLAVNQNGCIVGIPSAVLMGNYQNLGVVIPPNIIVDFFDEAINQLSTPTP